MILRLRLFRVNVFRRIQVRTAAIVTVNVIEPKVGIQLSLDEVYLCDIPGGPEVRLFKDIACFEITIINVTRIQV